MERRTDLDYLRVVCIAILLGYHVGMFFVSWDWHLKNPQRLTALEPVMEVLHVVRMPLLMLIAGASTALALGKRRVGALALDRTKRLLLPLVFGMLVVVPPQIYVERVANGEVTSSFLSWWPSVLEGRSYPAGNTSWHHLWFIAYLFVYCMLALPLFAWLDGRRGQAFLVRFEAVASRGWNLLLLFAPLALIRIALRDHPETHGLFDDPKTFATYGWLFVVGHALGRCTALADTIAAQRHRHLAVSVALLAVLVLDVELPFALEVAAVWVMAWAAMLAALGYARAHVRRRARWLVRAQELAYPFYIWHQTAIVVLAFFLLRWDPALEPWPRFFLLLTASFAVSWLLCELVARVTLLRPLFGMAPRRRAAPALGRLPSARS